MVGGVQVDFPALYRAASWHARAVPVASVSPTNPLPRLSQRDFVDLRMSRVFVGVWFWFAKGISDRNGVMVYLVGPPRTTDSFEQMDVTRAHSIASGVTRMHLPMLSSPERKASSSTRL